MLNNLSLENLVSNYWLALEVLMLNEAWTCSRWADCNVTTLGWAKGLGKSYNTHEDIYVYLLGYADVFQKKVSDMWWCCWTAFTFSWST